MNLPERYLSKLRTRPNGGRDIRIWTLRKEYNWTFNEIGLELGLTRERVRQIVGKMERAIKYYEVSA